MHWPTLDQLSCAGARACDRAECLHPGAAENDDGAIRHPGRAQDGRRSAENFINVFRAEIGREEYTRSTTQKGVMTFLENLKRQTDAYMEEAKAEMMAAGFKSTAWDNLRQ